MKGKDDNDILAEFLVILIQNLKDDPFNMLMSLCEPIVYSLMSKYFYAGYVKSDMEQEARKVLVETINEFDLDAGMVFLQFYHMSLSNHYNKLVRQQKTHKRRVNMNTSSLDELTEKAGPHVQGISSVMSQPEEATIANEAFADYVVELSTFEKEVFILFLSRKGQEKIAEELDCKLDQVTNALYRCSTKLRSALS